ncbi:phenazine biosynthesis protein [Paenibacillus sp. NAIST15-1]|nr:phenazine biosynthesis protein [Paenibacillus sp. NAIST15-1]
MNLCGHATTASLYCLHSKGYFGEKKSINIETKAGILPIEFTILDGRLYIKMKQNRSQFIPFQGDIARLAESIGLQVDDIDLTTPIKCILMECDKRPYKTPDPTEITFFSWVISF